MARNEDKQMTLAEVLQIQPNEKGNLWIQGNLSCGITNIKHKVSKGKNIPFVTFEFYDPSNGSIRLKGAFFQDDNPRSDRVLTHWPRDIVDGCIIETTGLNGMKDDQEYGKQFFFGPKGSIRKLGDWVPPKTAQNAQGSTRASNQGQRSPQPAQTHSGAPTVVQIEPQDGQAVGASLKMAHDSIIAEYEAGELPPAFFDQPDYLETLYDRASDILRIGNFLKAGKLAPRLKDRMFSEPEEAPAPEPEPEPETLPPGDESGTAFPQNEDIEEDSIPF